jgi:hypothetical protein
MKNESKQATFSAESEEAVYNRSYSVLDDCAATLVVCMHLVQHVVDRIAQIVNGNHHVC